MTMALAQQLSDWLARTDIAWLELRGPGVHLCLRNEGGRVQPAPSRGPDGVAATTPVCAPTVGVFLHAHPLRGEALAPPGAAVAAGQAIGLLRIGALLLPVAAPCSGIMAAVHVADGATVGYGAALADIVADASA